MELVKKEGWFRGGKTRERRRRGRKQQPSLAWKACFERPFATCCWRRRGGEGWRKEEKRGGLRC
jgi:hypothetical protein